MKKIFTLRLCTFVFVLLNLSSLGQDIHFSQFYMTSLSQNPAMAGYNHDFQALLNYKTQWQSVPSPYKTMAGSFDAKFKKEKVTKGFWAGGINFFNDKAGDARMNTMQANLSLAYHVHMSRYSTFGGGLQAGFAQRSINSANLQWGNQFDGMNYNPSFSTGETGIPMARAYVDCGAGVLWNYNNTSTERNVAGNSDLKITLGASAFHLNQPKYSFYQTNAERLDMKFVVHGNALVSLKNTNIGIAPGFFYYRQGGTQEIYAGGMLRYKLGQDSKYTGIQKGASISLGGYWRTKDAVIATLLFEYSQYAIGFSYDVNTSYLRTASSGRGGFEISLRYVNPNPFLYKSKGRI